LQAGGESEAFLGNQGLTGSFQIITKASMGMACGADRDGVITDGNASLKALKIERVSNPSKHRWVRV
jgi:hypothetical protein